MTLEPPPSPPKPAVHLVATTLVICSVEFIIMMVLPALNLGSRLIDTAIDVSVILISVITINFLLLYKPLKVSLDKSREFENRFKDLAEVGSDWFWEMDENLRFTSVSSNYEKATGAKCESLIGKSRADIAVPRGMEKEWWQHLATLDRREPFKNFEYQTFDHTGQAVWVRVSGHPFFDDDGNFKGYRGTGTECTAERNARDAENRFKNTLAGIMDRSLIGYLVLESVLNQNGKIADFRVQYINRKAQRYLRGSQERFLGKLIKMQLPGAIDDDLFERAERTVRRGEPFDVEKPFRIGRTDHWFRVLGVKFDDGIIVSFTDITRRRVAERDLRLTGAVFDTSAEAMMITDAENKIVSVNPAFTKLTGYKKQEVLGQDPSMLGSGRHDKEFFKKMWATLYAHDHWTGELWNRRKDGGLMVSRATISVIRDQETGDITNYVEVFGDITSQKRESEAIRYLANHDALTGLPNRTLLEDRVKTAIEKANRNKNGLAIFYIDLDRFKPINDTHGHLVGDQILQNVAERMQVCLRASDTVARVGGDEFVILCLEGGSKEELAALAEKIRSALQTPFRIGTLELTLDASIGIAVFPEHGQSFIDLVSIADDAMYQAKRGSTKVVVAK